MTEREAMVIRTHAELFGDEVRVTLTVDLPAGVHIEPHQPTEPNLVPTVLEVEGLSDVTVTYPTPVIKDLGWKDLSLTVFQGTLEFIVQGRVQQESKQITGTLSYQPCVGGACLPPRTVPWASPTVGTSAYSVVHALAPRPAAVAS
jgi:DsbC/DsbD-like thiol-disulfide interchange protein